MYNTPQPTKPTGGKTFLKWTGIVIGSFFVLLIVSGIIGAANSVNSDEPIVTKNSDPAIVADIPAPVETEKKHVVVLEVEATEKSNIRFNVNTINQDNSEVVPAGKKWSKTFDDLSRVGFITLTVDPVKVEMSGGQNTCRIIVDGVAVEEKSNMFLALCSHSGS